MRFAYVGWVGFGNLGDDAIAEALLGQLRPDEVVYAAHALKDLPHAVGRGGAGDRHLLLGGGTAIGRRNWRTVLNVAGVAQARRRPWFMIGAGVEDPTFSGRNSFSGRDELHRWRRTLGRFDRVTVRGPRSAELLADVGVEARVVGDPALLLEPADESRADGARSALGLCLGFGDDLWGHAPRRVLDAVTETAVRQADSGREVRLLVMNEEDDAAAQHVVDAVDERHPGSASKHRVGTGAEFFAALDGCHALVAQRLHGAVLAAAAGVPMIALEYQPKCRDFMASIGQDDLSLRCDVVSADLLTDALERLDSSRFARVEQIALAVKSYRAALTGELTRIREVATTSRPTTR